MFSMREVTQKEVHNIMEAKVERRGVNFDASHPTMGKTCDNNDDLRRQTLLHFSTQAEVFRFVV